MSSSIPFRLLLDPHGALLERVGARRQSLVRYIFDVRAWLRWLRAFATYRRQYRITGHYSEVPAVVVVDATGTVRYRHVGSGIGDYPPFDEVIAALG